MEIIKSLRREVKRRSLTKLKLDLSKTTMKNIEKIISYLSKDLKEFDLGSTDPSEYLIFNNFQVNVEKVWNSNISDRVSKKYTKNNETVYEVTVTGIEDEALEIYTIPTVKIPDKNRKYLFQIPNLNDRKKILDINYLYGVLKTLDIVYDEITQKENFYLSDEFKNISIFKERYLESEVKALLSIFFKSRGSLYCLTDMDYALYSGVIRLIIDVTAIMQNLDLNLELSDKYNSDTNSECARAFETKKNIPQKILNVMNNTKFLGDFSYVEIDEGTELTKFHLIEREWTRVKKALNLEQYLDVVQPELRFRKLGKHRALGLYYPSLKCICVDTSSVSSFVHEFGHFIDYTGRSGQYSLQLDFYPLISEYKIAYNKYLIENNDAADAAYLSKKKKYFFTPTEVFARCLEIYLVNKGVRTSFLKGKEELIMSSGYPEVNKNFMELINNYYDKLFTLNLEELEEKEVVYQTTMQSKVEYLEPVVSSSGQLTFAI